MSDSIYIATLFSSSSGNCVYVRTPDGEFLIDAGVTAKAIQESLRSIGTSLENIRAVFVTHEHIDHVRGLPVIANRCKMPLYAPERCCPAIGKTGTSALMCLNPLSYEGERVEFGSTAFTSFHTPHDSADSCGYIVSYEEKKVFGLATDMGFITTVTAEALTGCEAVVIESNHDVTMLKNGPYSYPLKRRILGNHGHLSNEACAAFIPYLALNGTRFFTLAHLSKENNTPGVAYAESYGGLTKCNISVCTEHSPGDVSLAVAPPTGVCIVIRK